MENPMQLIADSLSSVVNSVQSEGKMDRTDTFCVSATAQSGDAVCIRKGYKHYGRGKNRLPVLIGVDMTVPKGAIYGLLGPSGCGKTTLLRCVVGKLRLDAGSVAVFGAKPGSAESNIPGAGVGYMPQEMSLYKEFSISETLTYFGKIFGMKKCKIEERKNFLLQLLELPPGQRLVSTLSGGQQRRLSFAAALIHEAPLLILDEPTVGVDPLLRQNIWNHMLTIVETGNTVIVITTHYIEEARQAHRVGMMRFGRLLSEDSPQALMALNNLSTLEDVFLTLCSADGKYDTETGRDPTSEAKLQQPQTSKHSKLEPSVYTTETHQTGDKTRSESFLESSDVLVTTSISLPHVSKIFSLTRLSAVTEKNFKRMWRNIGFLVFQFLLPIIQVSLFCLAIGQDPYDLPMAIVNKEHLGSDCNPTWGCPIYQKAEFYSCRYMKYISNGTMVKEYFDDLDTALVTVKQGRNWGVITFGENFTEALIRRITGIGVSNRTIEESTIGVYLDMTSQQVAYTLQLRMVNAFHDFSRELLTSCGMNPEAANTPVVFERPVYGNKKPTFTEFMAPGVIVSITYFMAVGLTALVFVVERKEGLLERTWIAGVTAPEMVLAHLICQFFVMVGQSSLVLIFITIVFEIPCRGPIGWVIILTILQGLCGMSYGFMISALCDQEQSAIQMALGSFYPNLLLSGMIWPTEAIPRVLRYISYVLPQTYACEAMRSILSRGWDITYMQVWRGYWVTIAWMMGQLILSAVVVRLRK